MEREHSEGVDVSFWDADLEAQLGRCSAALQTLRLTVSR